MPRNECTPGQTVGPFFGIGLPFPRDSELVCAEFPGAVELRGTVFDGAGVAVPDALVELWQPDSAGRIPRASGSLRRDGWTFTGWGRAATDGEGRYAFSTVVPGPTAAGRSPYFAVTVFARGLLHRLFTRAYLPGATPDTDPVLSAVPPQRRTGLLCIDESCSGRTIFRFDIHLQGPDETVFLAYCDESR
ncbi:MULTISPECIES: protocatechuate 3,4-dioxygenase subunit alpha [Mycobacterium]|uniref:Protocatechuate 3,4-dioxygenase subunit alpha n=1 Tax=Mycobacterium kiyosense TaxID=2871094 RepID=A0A9P3UWR1_9MYCO|nr:MULTISPECIES: protocatechuate 3,4-dioxygenase subunit alpha [Mycobacterium]BDE13535.1 protocatechuate 3,4-dioxygenase subunit alpha [Mycobacterium sp. 20KCMC460]GLB85412.1 protocatechuate 3,4-dioxygenase subunit alpha [Mycobacterium kiyosense]GLB98870.1 protocatechuate 3,4-dioxygenase subunit alpha [Mycobacterium kiyosense]GLC12591.1 protocatechuate 3,4-dioxygenase subunit alpha [Mycobacterium kiyosense]GLD01053.1 protocatechuate 3,4-dioxygenase subunit alpha [Mycobacterium kiyosense]